MIRKNNLVLNILLLGLLFVLINANIALSEPEAPTIISSESSRRNYTEVTTIDATAGNVTALSIHGTTSTRTWQGFYGNITGALTLSNSANAVMYNWSLVVPKGQMYATTNSSINWAQNNIECYDYTNNDAVYFSIAELESSFSIPTDAADSIQNTFNQIDHETIYVASNTILENTCPSTKLYQNEAPGQDFSQLLLYAQDSSSVLFTSVIPGNTIGFDGSLMDFQLIVPSDGREGNTQPTTYYLYVELE